MALNWQTDGRRVWWKADYHYAAYRIEKDPTYRIYYVTYTGYNGSGEKCVTKIGSAYTVKEAKQIAERHSWRD